MPSPLLHSGVGLTLAWVARKKILSDQKDSNRDLITLTVSAIFLANAPDSDFLLGLIFNKGLYGWHRHATHSLLFSFLIVALPFFLMKKRMQKKIKNYRAIFFMAAFSHPLLDMLSLPSVGGGLPLFWPISHNKITLPFGLFGNFSKVNNHLFTKDNLLSLLIEILLLSSIFMAIRNQTPTRKILGAGIFGILYLIVLAKIS